MKEQSTSRIICLLHMVFGTRYMYLKSNRWYVMWIDKQSSDCCRFICEPYQWWDCEMERNKIVRNA